MERVTTLPINVSQGTDLKGTTSSSVTENKDNNSDFPQILAKRIRAEKSGKEATISGKEATKKASSNSNNVNDSNVVAQQDSVSTPADLAAEQLGKQKTFKDKTIDGKSIDDKSTEDVSNIENRLVEQNVIADNSTLNDPKQWLLLLQNAENTLTSTVENKELQSGKEALISNTPISAMNVFNDDQRPIADLNVVDDKSIIPDELKKALALSSLSEQGKAIKVDVNGVPSTTPSLKDYAYLPVEPPELTRAKALLAENQLLLDDGIVTEQKITAILGDKLLSADELKKLMTELSNKTKNLTEQSIASNVTDPTQTNDKLNVKEQLLVDDNSLKAVKQKQAEITPMPVNPVLTDVVQQLQSKDGKNNVAGNAELAKTDQTIAENISTDKSAIEASFVEKKARETQNDKQKLATAFDIKTVLANTQQQQVAAANLVDNTTNSNNYSDSELRDIQTMQAITNRATDTNIQNQKLDVVNQMNPLVFNRKDFTSALQDKVMIMVQQKLQQVDIRLDPPELGQMQVRLQLQNDQANVQFIVQNQQVRDSLEQNMPRLREMLAQQGVDVGNANIQQNNQQAGQGNQQGVFDWQDKNYREDDFEDNSTQIISANLVKASATGVDYYA